MNRRTPLFLCGNLKKFSFPECAFDVSTCDQTLALLFLPLCDNRDLKYYLLEILAKIPINNDTLDTRWSIQSFLGFLNYRCDNDMSNEMSINDFFTQQDQVMKNILPHINKTDSIDDKLAHNLSFYIQLLRDLHPGIFYSVLPNLQTLISGIGHERIYKAVGINLITFCKEPPIEFLSNRIDEINTSDISSFFQFHRNYIEPQISHAIQRKISKLYPFPKCLPSIPLNSLEFSLVNSSLMQNLHFIDIIVKVVNNAFISALGSAAIREATETVQEFLPYLIIANQSILYSDVNLYSQLLSIKFEHSIASQIIDRFQNDFRLLNLLSNLTDEVYCYGDLLTNSFPYYLQNSLLLKGNASEDVLKMSNLRFFTVTDQAASIDFDFIRAFAAFSLFFSVWQHPTSGNVTNIVNQISLLLSNIQNAGTQSMVIIDLFSCIFVRSNNNNIENNKNFNNENDNNIINEDGKSYINDKNIENDVSEYVCHPFVAAQLVQVLVPFDITPYITGAGAVFEKRRALNKADTTLNSWFENDLNQIYNAIESGNWPLADKLTVYLPYYRKLFTRASSASHLMKDGTGTYQAITKYEVNLSIFPFDSDLLKSLRSKFIAYSPIVERRIQKTAYYQQLQQSQQFQQQQLSFGSEVLTWPIDDEVKWVPINKFLAIFNKNPLVVVKKVPQHYATTIISKSLHTFLKYLHNYYRCSRLVDSATFDSLEDLFAFNIQKALAGPIKVGEYRTAEELASAANIDLFSFIFENISSFDVDGTFLEKMNQLFPSETTALIVSRRMNGEITLKKEMQKIVDYFSPKQKEEEVTANSILRPDFDDYDDAIFLVDHKELYSRLMKLDDELLATTYYDMVCFISYVSSKYDQKRLNQIQILHNVRRLTKSKRPNEIITDMVKKGDEQNDFPLIIEYLTNCVPDYALASPLCQLFSLSLSNDSHIDTILQTFPDRYEIILSRFFHVTGVLKHLTEFAPEDKKQYLKGLTMLPDQIFADSNIFEIDTISQSYIRNTSHILEMPKDVAALFNDSQLFAILNGVSNSPLFYRICFYLYKFFKDKEAMITFWSDKIEKKLKVMNVNTIQKEIDALEFFGSLKEPLNSINHSKFSQFRALSKIVDSRPFLRHRVVYSFVNLGKNEFSDELLLICGKIDEEEVTVEISSAFNINLDQFYLERSKTQLIFGDFIGSIETIRTKSLKIDWYSTSQFYDSTFGYLIPLSKLPFAKYENIRENTIERAKEGKLLALNIFQNLSYISKQTNVSPSSEAQSTLNILIAKYCSIGPALSLLVSFKQFGQAYDLVNTIADKDTRTSMFIHNLFLPVLYNNLFTMFSDFIFSVDTNLRQTGVLWDSAIQFFTLHEMSHGLFHTYLVKNQLEDAALIGLGILETCDSFDTEITLLGRIIYCLRTSLNFRKSGGRSSVVTSQAIQSNISCEKIQFYLEISELQLALCQIYVEQGIPFSSNNDYNIISSKEGAINVAALLYLNQKYKLLEDVKRLTKISLADISYSVCETLSNEELPKIREFWRNIKNHKKTLGPLLAYELLKALALSSNRKYVPSMIYECFEREDQCNLFLEYNFVAESFTLAVELNRKDIIPLIAHRAALFGDAAFVDDCNRILSYYYK